MITTQGRFTLMDTNDFTGWIKTMVITRRIQSIQHHHTWCPSYINFDKNNHFALQQSMRDAHLDRGFSDIAQHFTTFPDGKICTGRSLNLIPAGIKGANTGSICVENLGNFDRASDNMNPVHRDSIVYITAVLLKYFGINAHANSILYHHWFDLITGVRTDGIGNTKTCPGVNFFGGNSVEDCQNNFIPLVILKMNSLVLKSGSEGQQSLNVGRIIADNLNVRSGPSSEYKIIEVIHRGVEVNCYKEKNKWWRIHPIKDYWINSKYIKV